MTLADLEKIVIEEEVLYSEEEYSESEEEKDEEEEKVKKVYLWKKNHGEHEGSKPRKKVHEDR